MKILMIALLFQLTPDLIPTSNCGSVLLDTEEWLDKCVEQDFKLPEKEKEDGSKDDQSGKDS